MGYCVERLVGDRESSIRETIKLGDSSNLGKNREWFGESTEKCLELPQSCWYSCFMGRTGQFNPYRKAKLEKERKALFSSSFMSLTLKKPMS